MAHWSSSTTPKSKRKEKDKEKEKEKKKKKKKKSKRFNPWNSQTNLKGSWGGSATLKLAIRVAPWQNNHPSIFAQKIVDLP